MIIRKQKVSVLLVIVMLLSLWMVLSEKATAAEALPKVSSEKSIYTYTLASSGKVEGYTDSTLTKKADRAINCATDECIITEIKKQAVKVTYTTSSGKRSAWFERKAFTARDIATQGTQLKFKSTKKIPAYKWKNKSNTYGYVPSGASCYLLVGGFNSDWLQIICQNGSSYKMGWVKRADARDVIWPLATGIVLNETSVTLNEGKAFLLKATVLPSNARNKTVTWKSSNNHVATVSEGKVTAVKAGEAVITASTSNGKKATCKIIVKKPAWMMPMKNAYICEGWGTVAPIHIYTVNYKYHLGLDLASKTGDKGVYSASKGKVAAIGTNAQNGKYVIIEHRVSQQTVYSFYCHLNSYSVKKGQAVQMGTKIGEFGGTCTDQNKKHMHFAIVDKLRTNGSYQRYGNSSQGNKSVCNGVTYYNPSYVVKNSKLP